MKNILQMLERSADLFSTKTAFADDKKSITYSQLINTAMSIGSFISKQCSENHPIAILLPRSTDCICAMMGVLYSGNFYVVIDDKMPADRIDSILSTLKPSAIITNEANLEKANSLKSGSVVMIYNDIAEYTVSRTRLSEIREKMIDTDPAYALFTSGSTGTPKGAVISHRNLISYSEWFTKTFEINSHTVFGSQTPFYFSMSVSDVYATICKGATLQIIQKQLFSFPMLLLEFLNQRAVNTIYWVPSALCIIANWKVLDYGELPLLKTILFAGEVMPTKQLNYWIKHIPDAKYANLFGPTETTDICTYYTVNRSFADDETLPIGTACDNCDVFIVNESGKRASMGEEGELYVRGSFVAMGYYGNPEKTSQSFVQNPLNNCYPEIVYKTGDIVKYNELNELIYICRKDFQIKRMGYRIELGEIEAAASAVDGVVACAAVYQQQSDRLLLVFQGKGVSEDSVFEALKKRLPAYMLPNAAVAIKQMPLNQNGKIDRKLLMSEYK